MLVINFGAFECHVHQNRHGRLYSLYVCADHNKSGPLWCFSDPQNKHQSYDEACQYSEA